MQRFAALVLLASAAGCAWRKPEVVTPVRADTATIVTSPPQVTVTRPVFSVADDPFRRIDRQD